MNAAAHAPIADDELRRALRPQRADSTPEWTILQPEGELARRYQQAGMNGIDLAPTSAAIDAWRAHERAYRPADAKLATQYAQFMVNIRTRKGSWRCVTSRVQEHGHVWYWTIRGEGSSNGGRETVIREDQIAVARGFIVGADRLPAAILQTLLPDA